MHGSKSPEYPGVFQEVICEEPVVGVRLFYARVVYRVRVGLFPAEVDLVFDRSYSTTNVLLRELLDGWGELGPPRFRASVAG